MSVIIVVKESDCCDTEYLLSEIQKLRYEAEKTRTSLSGLGGIVSRFILDVES